ncbi:hypothetical protein [Merismopedia glauca]|uniref:Uncharacterized protein n=1 Tax=Merismopedia glauca CCAP 1448/3 TaxID=1296344 RepID=A0A2T1BY05_9CYAN|nr:hypothetical protein [Merismopedia glauca]PSB00906.1 hypothetical protein C7B64_21045 [Merismopedia glauca CCAP 1448/3]
MKFTPVLLVITLLTSIGLGIASPSQAAISGSIDASKSVHEAPSLKLAKGGKFKKLRCYKKRFYYRGHYIYKTFCFKH